MIASSPKGEDRDMNQDNRKRALAEVVAVDAWHQGFTQKVDRVDLHVDVAFMSGRVGGEPGDDVRFRLRLKRAEVVVIVPPTEPAKIDKASVSRDTPQIAAKATEKRLLKTQISAGAKGKAKVNQAGPGGGLDLTFDASSSRSKETAITITQALQAMSVTQTETADGAYSWIVEPAVNETLAGKPWDASKAPRLKVIDKRPDRTKGIEPNIRIEVRCRREDLEITDIALKNQTVWAGFAKDPLGRNKVAAAEALIRTKLFQAGLMAGDLDDPFAQMTLCATIAESST